MRRLVAGVVAVGVAVGAAGYVQSQSEPAVDHVSVRAGEGLWQVAARLCPHAVGAEFTVLQQANPWYTVGLKPGTVLHRPDGSCPAAATTTTSSSSTTTSTSTTSTSTSTTSTSTTVASGPCPAPANTPGGADPWGGCWPGEHNTGVPAGVTLTAYSGPCRITTAGTVIDAKTINCNPLTIAAANVTVSRSLINGRVLASSGTRIVDSTIRLASYTTEGTLLGYGGFTAIRVELVGGNRPAFCEHGCTIVDSWAHGQVTVGAAHVSGVRQGEDGVIRHNTLHCDASETSQGGGCSAPLTGYGDFGPVRNNLIERNLFVAGVAGYCAYGGSSGDNGSKPYGDQAENIRFVENVFQRGPSGRCGVYAAVGDWDGTRPGNLFIGNTWDDGTPLRL